MSGTDGWGVALKTLVAVDPGDVHVGIAEFVEHADGWECLRAYELSHEDGADEIARVLLGGKLDVLVVEQFRLRGDLAKQQTGSEMLTAQLIGVIKYLVRHYNVRWDARYEDPSGAAIFYPEPERPVRCNLVMQPPSIQKPTAAILRAKGVTSEAKGNAHAKSAELHGWAWILRHADV